MDALDAKDTWELLLDTGGSLQLLPRRFVLPKTFITAGRYNTETKRDLCGPGAAAHGQTG